MPSRRGRSHVLLALAVLLIPAAWPAPVRAEERSQEYRDNLRRTSELRRQRRALRDQPPVGKILPWPMPPSLIIRHTPRVHDEIESLLWQLRGG